MSGEIKKDRFPKIKDGKKPIIVGGFATCGSHSYVKYLREVKGREVILMEGFFQRTGCDRYGSDVCEVHFITRENCPLGLSIDELNEITQRYPDSDVTVVRLEEMMLLPDFPHENASS